MSLTPESASIQTGESLPLSASVSKGGVTWQSSPAAGGTLTSNSLDAMFSASVSSVYTVTVTSTLDTNKRGVATITVTDPPPAPVTVGITPQAAVFSVGGIQTLTATGHHGNVTWQVSGGTLTPMIGTTVAFTAPASGVYTITVISIDDPDQRASATVTVVILLASLAFSITVS